MVFADVYGHVDFRVPSIHAFIQSSCTMRIALQARISLHDMLETMSLIS